MMRSQVICRYLIVGFIFHLAVGSFLQAQTETELSPFHQESLAWLDKYRKEQVLFHDSDVVKVRERLMAASSDEVEQWLSRTEQVRAALDSPEWKDTRRWLKDFLKVQAIYSDQQLDKFHDEAKDKAATSPEEFIDLLIKIEEERAKMVGGAANAAELRKKKLRITEAYKKDQAAQRLAARREASASRPPAQQPPSQPVRKDAYRPPSPLVDSLDVARWSVMRNFWGR